mgnify:CR=1 FL=1
MNKINTFTKSNLIYLSDIQSNYLLYKKRCLVFDHRIIIYQIRKQVLAYYNLQ